MVKSVDTALDFIGLCLAPFDDERTVVLAGAAEKIGDWEQVLLLAGNRHVSPLVFTSLRDSGLSALVPAEIFSRFEKVYLLNATVNALRLHQVLAVTSLLRERGVKALFFKGSSLVMSEYYPDAGHRMFSDVDLLVNPSHREEVREAFARVGGWIEQPSQVMEDWEVTSWIDEYGSEVEVHWALKPHNDVLPGLREQRLFENAVEVSYRGRPALVPSVEDRLILAALHFTAHHYFDSSYFHTGVGDVAHVLRDGADGIDWDRLVSDLGVERMLEHVAVALELSSLMTEYEPLSRARVSFYSRAKGLEKSAAPLAASLERMARKPYVFHSFYERRLFVKKPFSGWLKYFHRGARRRLAPSRRRAAAQPKRPAGRDFEGITGEPSYEHNFFDLDFLRYLYNLYRFDRKIGYRIRLGPHEEE